MDRPNVILIVLDTLRKDYSGNLERKLVKEFGFTSYENAISPSPWTIPTHASIFTGLYPVFHGVHESKKRKVPDVRFQEDGTYLHETLSSIGYKTYLFTANFFIGPDFGIKSFHEFHDTLKPLIEDQDREELNRILKKYQPKNEIDLIKALMKERKFVLPFKVLWRIITRYGEGWPKDKGSKVTNKLLNETKFERPSYIFINLMEVHEPYSLFEGFTDAPVINRLLGEEPELIQKWKEGYPKQVRYLEKRVTEMMEILDDKNLLETSIIIITSDHGQLLGEGNRLGHGVFLDDELLRVPLLIKVPNRAIHMEGPVSLTRLKSLILSQIQGENIPMVSEYALAESFGTHYPYPSVTKEKIETVKNLEKYRIKLYHKDGIAVFNVDEWGFDEIRAEELAEFENIAKRIIVNHLKLLTSGRVNG